MPARAGQIFGANLVVIITNSTPSPVEVSINGVDGRVLVPFQTGQWPQRLFEDGSVDVSISARICRGTETVSTIPAWATDVERWGPQAAITSEYLQGAPTEDDLKRRVDLLKRALDGGRVLGRDTLKRQVDQWFDVVKETGVWMRVVCRDPFTTTEPYRKSVNMGNGRREQITLHVEADRDRYRLNQR
jgi:hypothetical protein